jgi:hypothetical protein
LAKQGGVAVDVLDCEIALRHALDLIWSALFSIAMPSRLHHPNQFCFFSFEGTLEVAAPGK